MKRLFSQQGNITFYALALTPVFLSLCVGVVDLSNAFNLRDDLQREADRIASTAAQLLPDTRAASAYLIAAAGSLKAGELIRQGSMDNGDAATDGTSLSNQLVSRKFLVHDSAVKVTLRAVYESNFDMFLPSPVRFTMEQDSVVEIVPTDTVLVLSDGGSLRPPLGAAWGEEQSWPRSSYFNCVALPSAGEVYTAPGTNYRDATFQRSATQSCFNPALSALKHAAVGVVDSLGAHSLNRIGVLFTPGTMDSRGVATLRSLRGEFTEETVIYFHGEVGGFPTYSATRAESRWRRDEYRETTSGLGDEACVLFSQLDDWGGGERYRLASPPPGFGLKHEPFIPREVLQFNPCGSFHRPYDWMSGDYIDNNLRLREAIYWHAAKSPLAAPGYTAEPNFTAALTQAFAELTFAPAEAVLRHEIANRGNMAHRPIRQVIVITDTLPPVIGAFQFLVQSFLGSEIRVVVAAFHHSGLSVISHEQLSTNVGALQALDPARRLLRVFEANSESELTDVIAPLLSRYGRSFVVRT